MEINELLSRAEKDLSPVFAKIEENELFHTERVIRAFQKHRVSYRHFAPSTGYGYDDIGRDTLSGIFSELLGTEKAIVRPQIVSGTHALGLCLFGILRPGDKMISAAGAPYDTLEEIIGTAGQAGNGSLKDLGVSYEAIPLKNDLPDEERIIKALDPTVKLVLIQRSRGYDWRKSLDVDTIDRLIDRIHSAAPQVCVMVDNCYGEFTARTEPKADLMAGSLIKNAGGGIAPTGGYFAGKKEYVDLVSYRLTTPGIGAEVGSYAAGYQPFYQGLFMAPHTVAQALKSAALFSRVFELLGYDVSPRYDEKRNDIIQAIRFGEPELLIRFCQAIQKASPIDSDAVPEPWDMPGYQYPVIMAAGTFVSGASVELSADAPIRAPYNVYLQGALTYSHGKFALKNVLRELFEPAAEPSAGI